MERKKEEKRRNMHRGASECCSAASAAPSNRAVHFVEALKYVVLHGAIGHCFCRTLSLFIVLLFGTVCARLCVGHGLPSLCLCVMDILFTEEQVHNLPRTVYVSLLL